MTDSRIKLDAGKIYDEYLSSVTNDSAFSTQVNSLIKKIDDMQMALGGARLHFDEVVWAADSHSDVIQSAFKYFGETDGDSRPLTKHGFKLILRAIVAAHRISNDITALFERASAMRQHITELDTLFMNTTRSWVRREHIIVEPIIDGLGTDRNEEAVDPDDGAIEMQAKPRARTANVVSTTARPAQVKTAKGKRTLLTEVKVKEEPGVAPDDDASSAGGSGDSDSYDELDGIDPADLDSMLYGIQM